MNKDIKVIATGRAFGKTTEIIRDLQVENQRLKAENEKLKFQSSVFNEALKQNRYLVTKLKKANETIHGEFCGKKCHPLHLEVEI